MTTARIIQLLTSAALLSLLFASGLRLPVDEVRRATADAGRIVRVLVLNFVVVPALSAAVVWWAGFPPGWALGVLVLAAAPFAPVVPIFTRLARGDLALAAALTAVVPLVSAFVTPWVAAVTAQAVGGMGSVRSDPVRLLGLLALTITAPLVAGMGVRHWAPHLARRWLRPMEVVSEAVGAASLTFVVVAQWRGMVGMGVKEWVVMAALFEVSLALGYLVGGPSPSSRRVIALGSSNRNIALALLVAATTSGDNPVLTAVVSNGLLMILMGLLHTGWWALSGRRGA